MLNDNDVIDPDEAGDADEVVVQLVTPQGGAVPGAPSATNGEAADLHPTLNNLSVRFDTPENPSTSTPMLFSQSKDITVVTLHDPDAEDEGFTLDFASTGFERWRPYYDRSRQYAYRCAGCWYRHSAPGYAHHRRRLRCRPTLWLWLRAPIPWKARPVPLL